MTVPTATEQLRAYRSTHVIPRQGLAGLLHDELRCSVDGIRVLPVKGGRWRHHPDDVARLVKEETHGNWDACVVCRRAVDPNDPLAISVDVGGYPGIRFMCGPCQDAVEPLNEAGDDE